MNRVTSTVSLKAQLKIGNNGFSSPRSCPERGCIREHPGSVQIAPLKAPAPLHVHMSCRVMHRLSASCDACNGLPIVAVCPPLPPPPPPPPGGRISHCHATRSLQGVLTLACFFGCFGAAFECLRRGNFLGRRSSRRPGGLVGGARPSLSMLHA